MTGATAIKGDVHLRQTSFKSALLTLAEFLPILNAEELCDVLFRCCLQHVVGDRPDRYEPRVVKRKASSRS